MRPVFPERWFTEPRANLLAIAQLLGGIDVDDPMVQGVLDRVVDGALCHHATARAGTLAAWLHRQLLAAAPGGVFGAELRTVTAALAGYAEAMQPVAPAPLSAGAAEPSAA